MLRITMDLLLVANGVERLSRVVRVPEILSMAGAAEATTRATGSSDRMAVTVQWTLPNVVPDTRC
jgi:hypothetical protein